MILKALMSYAARRLRDGGARVCETQGAYYLFPQFGTDCHRFANEGLPESDKELCERIMTETAITSLPGTAFGRGASELFIRLACVDFDGHAALENLSLGVEPDEKFLGAYCQPTVTGIDRLAEWLAGKSN